jgi:hypothetical protein
MNNENGNQNNLYKQLATVNECARLPECIKKSNANRSSWDKMASDLYTLGVQPTLVPPSSISNWSEKK